MIMDPDGFIGTLLAIEGISDAGVILNGPTGCRGYPAIFSNRHYPRKNARKSHDFEERFFFGLSRMPCTFLDADDYIHGSTEKLREVLPLIAEKEYTFLAIVNSPGASLIGDDLKRFIADARLSDRCMACEGAAYSRPFSEGFDEAVVSSLQWLRLNHLSKVKTRVNLLGFSMIQKYWQGDISEIVRTCELMGLSVVAVPGAGSPVAELRESTSASCNLVVYPEYCRKTAEFYQHAFGIPAVYSPGGVPIGFDPTETWIRTVAEATGADPKHALEDLRKKRMQAYHQLARCSDEDCYKKSARFSIRGDTSLVLSLTTWLYEYLGMHPVSLSFLDGKDPEIEKQVSDYIIRNHLPQTSTITDPYETSSDLFFGDILTGRDLMLSGLTGNVIELYNRTSEGPEFIKKTHLGAEGTLWMLEMIFRAIRTYPTV